ncbi:MAG: type II toxin-antitoxin system HigB family toxin [bacterium]|nr:type II toxin-antitoxin system HigB family toxin [bacterium]
MNVVSRRGLIDATGRHPDALDEVLTWYKIARKATWKGLHEVRRTYPTVDQVGDVLIFNIRGNRYRLITRVSYQAGRLYVKGLLTHSEYDRKEWMKWV